MRFPGVSAGTAAKIAALTLVIDFFVVALAAVLLQHSRAQYEESAALATQNLAELLRHNIGDHFDQAAAVAATDGAFGGTTAEQLRQMFPALQLGPHGSVALRDAQLQLRLRDPAAPAAATDAPAPAFRLALAGNAQAGTYAGDDSDGMPRLHSYRRHERHFFYVDVGLAYADFLEPWRREAWALATATAGFVLLTLFSAWHLHRTTRERALAERDIARLLAENRRLLASLFSAGEDQRRKLARDLHDELGQWLAAIQVNARIVGDFVAVCADADVVDSARTIADSALEINHVIRDMVHMLRPPLLDTMGLLASLEDLIAHWRKYQARMRCSVNLGEDIDGLPEAVNIAVYRILQEALANVTKHARANAVRIALVRGDGKLTLDVQDDGIGMPAVDDGPAPRGVGLLGIRERAVALGGTLRFGPPPGCHLQVQIPTCSPT